MLHGLDDLDDKRGSVVHDLNDDVVGQGWPDSVEPVPQVCGDGVAVLAHQHEREPEHDLPLAPGRDRAATDLRADLDRGHVPHTHGGSISRGDHDVSDLLNRADAGDAPDDAGLARTGDLASTDVGVVALERLDQVAQREVELDERRGVGHNVELPLQASPGVDLGHAGDLPQLRLDDPVVQGPQVLDRTIRVGRAHDVVKDLAQSRGDGAERRSSHAVRQLGGSQPLGRVLPSVDDGGVVVECHDDL